MPALTARRPSLCLFCQLAPLVRRRRLLPHVQTASRSAPAAKRRPPRDDRHATAHGAFQFGVGRPAESLHFNRPSRGRPPFSPFRAARDAPGDFQDHISKRMAKLRRDFSAPEFIASLQVTPESFEHEWAIFERSINVWIARAAPEARFLAEDNPRARQSTEQKLKQLFYAQIFGEKFTKAEVDNQRELANLRYPTEWYPATRIIPRTVHMHVGPTNSGKTYHALKRLEEAESGIYMGPLRLLAHEVYTRLNAKGRNCALVTGEEQRMPEGETKMWSCTVEMAPLNQRLDVAVIDEIQMINHPDRGWAWTQAFLGIQAREIHLCGEARTVPLMRELCALVGDKVVVHEYERLTPLKVANNSLKGNLRDKLEKGDCIVSFSVLGIHALRKTIENATGRKCAIVYGSLPPETRAQQAKLFNDPNNEYDFLVASDAIGMGLNLSIKRVIFESTMKNNGQEFVPLQVSEIKQIAGRAGRYKTAHEAVTEGQTQDQASESSAEPADGAGATQLRSTKPGALTFGSRAPKQNSTVGYATTLENFDYPYLVRCMENEPEPIKTAGLFPPSLIVERFANYFPPGTPFSYIMLRLHEISDVHPRFHLCSLKDQLVIADVIHTIKNLSIQERIMICAAPTNVKDVQERDFLYALAKCIADNESGNLLELPIPLEVLDEQPSAERKYLYSLEQLHKMLVLYLWLSYRFPNVFVTRGLANYTKQLVEDKIEDTLSRFSFTQRKLDALKKKREQAMKNLEQQESRASEEEDTLPSDVSIPEPVRDILNDEQSFASVPKTDDADEYPTPEFELEEAEPEEAYEGESGTVQEPTQQEEHERRAQELSSQVHDPAGQAAPQHIDLPADRPDAPQPRL